MKRRFPFPRPSALNLFRARLLLTACLVWCGSARAYDGYYDPLSAMPVTNERPGEPAIVTAQRQYQLGQLLDYVRHGWQNFMPPALSSDLHNTIGFAIDRWHSTYGRLGLDPAEGGSLLPPSLSSVSSIMTPPSFAETEALWLSPSYHHARGILPFDDALTLGFNARRGFFDDRVRLDVHPFYAQNWVSTGGYWGTEASLRIGPSAEHSWGRIALRYDNGEAQLMDNQQRGFDMHTDLQFTSHLNLTAGAQQNEASDLGNYMLMRWSASFADIVRGN